MKVSWERIKEKIKELLPQTIFEVWFSPLSGFISDEKLIIQVPNEFTKNWLKENYHQLIEQVIKEFNLKTYNFVIKENPQAEQLIIPYNPVNVIGRNLSPKYTFEDFVVGKCNEFAFNVCYQIAENQPKGYMVYLYGNFGLGKTHLTQAVGNSLFSKGVKKVYYFTAQDFVNYLIKYLRSGMLEDFKEKIKNNCEILLLEGVHFFAGKEFTQNELILLLDYLMDQGKTVIFTSLKKPQELHKMESALRSRLSSGLIIKLNPPDFKTRKRIIKHKAEKLGYKLPYEVVEYLASRVKGDIRQIESVVFGLIARSSLLKEPINLSLAKELLNEMGINENINSDEIIIETTCRFFGISKEDIFSSSRRKEVIIPRQIIMYFFRNKINKSFKEIGKIFKKEHSTIIYNINSLEEKLRKDLNLKLKVDYLWEEISSELQDIYSQIEYKKIDDLQTSSQISKKT